MINVFLTKKEEMAKSGTGKKTSESEQLDEIMKENGCRNGYCGTQVMWDDIDPENDTRP